MGKRNYERVILGIVELQNEDVLTATSGVTSVKDWDVGGDDVYGSSFLE